MSFLFRIYYYGTNDEKQKKKIKKCCGVGNEFSRVKTCGNNIRIDSFIL